MLYNIYEIISLREVYIMNNEIFATGAGTWRIEDGFVRFFLLTGSERALLIDSGASTADARDIAGRLTDLPLTLLNTHADGDHTAGNAAFDGFYMHPEDYERCGINAKYPGCALLPLHDGDIIDLGGRELKIIAIPGHTYGSVAVLDMKDRVLYSGDSVQDGHIYMFGDKRSPERFASSLSLLAELSGSYDRIFPSHGSPELPAGYASRVLDAWNGVLAGTVAGRADTMFGCEITTYDAEGCGFFCDRQLPAKAE